MKKSKLSLLFVTAALSAACIAGCGKKEEATTTTEETNSIKIETVSTMSDASEVSLVNMDGYILNDFTGEWIDEKFENKKALSIMINNIDEAMPQTGIAKADMTFEFYVEGTITRFLCVFQDWSDLPKLGPIRSSRVYYVQMADMLDAFYGHVGWNIYAEDAINKLEVKNLNGLTNLSTIMYYRDETRYAPHNVYTDTDRIELGIDTDGYDRDHEAGYQKMFQFNANETDIANGSPANKISVPFGYNHPWFEYNSEDKTYYRFQYGDKQIDNATDEQLHYKNVLVMLVDYRDLVDGLLYIDWAVPGNGYYLTNGKYEPITWKQEGNTLHFYDASGADLKLNPGNSFIEVYTQHDPDGITIE